LDLIFLRFESNNTRRTGKTEFGIIEVLSAVNHTMAVETDKTSSVVILVLECRILGGGDGLICYRAFLESVVQTDKQTTNFQQDYFLFILYLQPPFIAFPPVHRERERQRETDQEHKGK
jgi:hypothetical protein